MGDMISSGGGILHRGLEAVNGDEGASLVISFALGPSRFDSDLEGYFNVSIIAFACESVASYRF